MDQQQDLRSSIDANATSDSFTLSMIPRHVADFLFDNYVARVATQYPIHYTPDLTAMHKAAFHQTDEDGNPTVVATPYDIFTLHLIMAISLSTAARSKLARANAIASGLFEQAMQQISHVLSNDLRGLQALVLVTQYAFLNPGVANFWLLTGFISQACIDLGLHRELPEEAPISHLERDLRRRVFWCAWEMETAVCGALLRPMTLLRKIITTEFPSQLEDSAITPAGIDPGGRLTKFTAQYIFRYRAVECDIVPVLFHNEPIPSTFQNLEEWMLHQQRTILDWKAEIHAATAQNTDLSCQSQWDEMALYSSIATDYILVTLFRPCPRIKEPSAENLLQAFSAAAGVADGSWKQANLGFGNSKYVFHSCYHSFSAAVTFCQALQRIKPQIFANYTWEQVEQDMETFTRFFTALAERWPAASRCLDEYERLLTPIKKEVMEFLAEGSQGVVDEMAMDMTLDLQEALNFGMFLNVIPPDLEVILGGYSYVPMDWEEEFDFNALGQDQE